MLILTIYLVLKALPVESWDDWGFGSAQTLMTVRHWAMEGFVYNKFLFIPIGYSKIVRYLDDPDLRHHSRGTITGKLIGNRLYYTHYPNGYLIPYALMAKLGFLERYWFRFLAILFSLTALILMYALFNLIASRTVAFLATFYYAASQMFLGLADSLANMPIDDFFRFALLFLSVWVWKITDHSRRRFLYILIWVLYFALSSSSYDSTFFIFIWLVGLDIIMTRKLQWKKWLVFGMAPIAAFILQMVQNIWYLGIKDALLDVYGSFKFRSDTGPGSNILERHIRAMFSPLTYMADLRARYIIPIVGFIILAFWKLRNLIDYNWPKIKTILLLGLAGTAYSFILISSGYFPYQGRQMAPFLGLLVASSTVLVCFIIKNFKNTKEKINKIQIVSVIILVILTGSLWFFQIQRTYLYIQEWPNNVVNQATIDLGKNLKELAGGQDTVVFRIDKESPYQYPQIDPITEYYIGMPVLSFKNEDDLMEDFKKLKSRSEFSFYSIIVVEDQEKEKEIRKKLGDNQDVFILNFY